MVKRSKKEDDYLGPSRGFMKLFHKTMMLLIFPLRKPWWFLLIILAFFMAPTFRGVKPAQVHLWYWQQIKELSSSLGGDIVNKAHKVMPTMDEVGKVVDVIAPGTVNSGNNSDEAIKSDASANLVSQPQRQVRRQAFEKNTQAIVSKASPVVAMNSNKNVVSIKPSPKLNLRYLAVPEKLFGEATVINANELKVAGQNIFLYGIFVQPISAKGRDGEVHLRSWLEGKNIDCQIVAYTYQNIATAICFVDDLEINHRMVELGYSQNVALD